MPPVEPDLTAHRPAVRYRIAIDCLAARFGGTAYAAIHLAQELADRDDVEAVFAIARRGSIVDRGLDETETLRVVSLPSARHAELPRRLAWESLRLPRFLADARCTALVTYSGMLPRPVPVPVVSHLLNPVALLDGGILNMARRLLIRQTTRWAPDVMSPSQSMARWIQQTIDCRIHMVPLGVDHELFMPRAAPGEELLCVADFYPHKRHDLLLAAWSRLPEPRPRLVFVGNPNVDLRWHENVRTLADSLSSKGDIEILSNLSTAALQLRYRLARLLILPSVRESFCMPVVEAAACGVPAVLTDIDVLRETGGGGAVYVSGDDAAGWANTIGTLLRNREQYVQLRLAAVKQSHRFSWARMAEGVVASLPASAESAATRAAQNRRWPIPLTMLAVLILAVAATVMSTQRPSSVAGATNRAAAADRVKSKAAALQTGQVVYGRGVSRVVPNPVASLRASLGAYWHVLAQRTIGRVSLVPAGKREAYFTFGLAATAPRAARLEVLTASGERELGPVSSAVQVLNFGPLRTPRSERGPIGIALISVAKLRSAAGPNVAISPIESTYLKPGDGIVRPYDLAQTGPGGITGLALGAGATAKLRVTPGLRGSVNAVLNTASNRQSGLLQITVAGVAQEVTVGTRAANLTAGPFPRPSGLVTITVPPTLRAGIIVASFRLVAAR